ncbi:hypothetical protein ACS04_24245 [Streptomyces roseus]|uniref:Uncharacterized protein n=1 Tax=Streptomyces roseus TaxID=66430 RepID=A0A0J6XJK0_9ACTN|nr:hypothetical protein ACS04_24245 [Streptomyces roseus]
MLDVQDTAVVATTTALHVMCPGMVERFVGSASSSGNRNRVASNGTSAAAALRVGGDEIADARAGGRQEGLTGRWDGGMAESAALWGRGAAGPHPQDQRADVHLGRGRSCRGEVRGRASRSSG